MSYEGAGEAELFQGERPVTKDGASQVSDCGVAGVYVRDHCSYNLAWQVAQFSYRTAYFTSHLYQSRIVNRQSSHSALLRLSLSQRASHSSTNQPIKMCFSTRPQRDYYYTEEVIPARRSPPRYHHSHRHGSHHHHSHSHGAPARVSYSSVTRETYRDSPRVSSHSHHRY